MEGSPDRLPYKLDRLPYHIDQRLTLSPDGTFKHTKEKDQATGASKLDLLQIRKYFNLARHLPINWTERRNPDIGD